MIRMLKTQIVLLAALFCCVGCSVDTEGLMMAEDLAKVKLKDGVYKGEYINRPMGLPFIETRSVVTIQEGKLQDIEMPSIALGKYKLKYRYALKKLPKEMVQQQSVVVDAVTGATYSSFAMMKAVQDAVNKAVVAKQTGLQ
ncbi:MAG: FMN-binding protein [Deltaproteobacteria bacterium]|nr:FMN-binding protein [Deltaproteobacteria bacterium]